MSKVILVTVSDDRFGRKEGGYKATQDKIQGIVNHNFNLFKDVELRQWTFDLIEKTLFYQLNFLMLRHADPGMNGRLYKPYVILQALSECQEGDYVIYNDCSPEMWKMPTQALDLNLDTIKYLCMLNGDILTGIVEWDTKPILEGHGIHTHDNFTLDLCMQTMGLEKHRHDYMHASGMIVLRKSKSSMSFVEDWLYWNKIDKCASLGNVTKENDYSYWAAEDWYKMGHRHDQSISGLLLNAREHNLIIPHSINGLNQWNFLNYCDPKANYRFVSSISNKIPDPNEIRKGSLVKNQAGQELKVFELTIKNDEEFLIVGKHRQSAYEAKRETLTLIKK